MNAGSAKSNTATSIQAACDRVAYLTARNTVFAQEPTVRQGEVAAIWPEYTNRRAAQFALPVAFASGLSLLFVLIRHREPQPDSVLRAELVSWEIPR